MVQDFKETLLPCSFRGISFPVSSITVETMQDQILHGRTDRQGEWIENTGRKSHAISVQVPCVNGIWVGPSEDWTNLFPDVYYRLIDAMNDRSSGDFVHPTRGTILVKPTSFSEELSATVRSGAMLTLSFLETVEDDEEEALLSDEAPIGQAEAAAEIVKTEIEGLDLSEDTPDLDDTLGEVKAIIDTPGLIAAKVGGKIDQMIGDVNSIIDSIENAAAIATPLERGRSDLAHALQACERFKDSANKIHDRHVLQRGEFSIKSMVVSRDTTIGRLSIETKNSIDDLGALNPNLFLNPKVSSGTLVTYFDKG